MAATESATQTASKLADEAAKRLEENTERVKEFNSALTESSKAGSRVAVDSYEKAAKSFFALQRQFVDTNQVEWVKTTSTAQIQFAEEVAGAWVKAARQLLK
jgi:hypothetical protein